MGILKKLLFILVGFILTGCYEVVDIQPDSKPVLCLNSLIIAGEKIKVHVFHTWQYTQEVDKKDIEVSDAVVEIYANDNLIDENYVAQEGDRVRIYARSAEYGEATAEVTVPVAVDYTVDDVRINVLSKWKYEDAYGGEGDVGRWENRYIHMNVNADVTLHDDPSVINYFEFYAPSRNFIREILGIPDDDENTIYYANSGYDGGDLQTDMEPIFGEHMDAFETVLGAGAPYGRGFFTDRQFDGKDYTLHLVFRGARYWIRMEAYSPELLNVGYEFKLYTVSESYYNWMIYRWYTFDSGMGDLIDMGLHDPIWAYSNVSTGAGVVAAVAVKNHKVDLAPLLKDEIDF